MERVTLDELGFQSRNETVSFLKKLWNQEKTICPIRGHQLELLHKKAKKSDLDWQCKVCNKTFRTLYLLDELQNR